MELGKYWVTVISHARPQNAKKMAKLIGRATWYVGKDEAMDYLKEDVPNVVESGRLCESRNRALEDAFKQGLTCVQLSDDLYKIYTPYFREDVQKRRRKEISFKETLAMMDTAESIFKLIGTSPTDNPLNWDGRDLRVNKFIIGDFMMIRPNDLRFDENLKLKEDYDYTLQHITQVGGTLRFDNILPTFGHRTNIGGAVEYRTDFVEQSTIEYLRKKWGRFIKMNPKRDNEILLNL